MTTDLDFLNQTLDHRLRQEDLERILSDLSRSDRDMLVNKIGDLLRRMSALMQVSNSIWGELSLKKLISRLIAIISEALTAERSTLFLLDEETSELFSFVVQGDLTNEIRFPATAGIAGSVFTSEEPAIINDAYADERFNPEVDRETGYQTRNILCVPVKRRDGIVIGVTQVLNKIEGDFNREDQLLLDAMTTHAATALESARLYERVERARHDESQLMEITSALSSELQLDTLLGKIMSITTEMLDADRSTLFLYDARSNQLWSSIAEGLDVKEIRFPATAGIAGSVLSTGETVNIPDAYADERFNQAVDRKTGYRTHNILCMPVVNKGGDVIGVTQVLNKRGGPFTERDEKRLRALTAQAAIALENAKLFEDVRNERNYSESILRSLSTGVVSLDAERRIIKMNAAASKILRCDEFELQDEPVTELTGNDNHWVVDSIDKVEQSGEPDLTVDADFVIAGGPVSVNLNVVPLIDINEQSIGYMLILEDISREKRVRNTMARYMAKEVADRLLEEGGESALGGTAQEVTVLFSDIRQFTTISESIGARETVAMLNEYFTEMVDIISNHHGILDKYIGDALMALFGAPFHSDDDADNAVAAAINMMAALHAFNERRVTEGRQSIDIGIGINTGEVIAGNIGSPKRMDYTVISDAVNLASRLEGANKFYGTRVLISESTCKALRKAIITREVDLIRVKGKQLPVAVYEVLDYHDATSFPHCNEAVEIFSAALTAYRNRDWQRASAKFTEILYMHPCDRPSQIYIERCAQSLATPPPDDWDGVWTMTSK